MNEFVLIRMIKQPFVEEIHTAGPFPRRFPLKKKPFIKRMKLRRLLS